MTLCSMVHEQTRLIHGDTPCDALQRTPGPPIQRGSTVLLPSCEALYDGGKVHYGRVGLSTQRTLRASTDERRGGKEWVSTSRSLRCSYPLKQNKKQNTYE